MSDETVSGAETVGSGHESAGASLAAFRERRLEEIASLKSRGVNPYP